MQGEHRDLQDRRRVFIRIGAASKALAQSNELPRTPEGKPDLQGIWQVRNRAAYDFRTDGSPHYSARPNHFSCRRTKAGFASSRPNRPQGGGTMKTRILNFLKVI